MRCKSTSSVSTDGYRAGSEIGEALREFSPEAILLFASINYEGQFPDLFAGIGDALDLPETVIFGGTSDGIYETGRVAHRGVCALALNSDGAARWSAHLEYGVAADSYAAARRCAESAVAALGGEVDFAFAFADGIKADGSHIVHGLSSVLTLPFIGGLAGDDRKFKRSFIFHDRRAHEDAVGVLAARGRVSFSINSASGWRPVGEAGMIEECHGSTLDRISGMSPQAFFREQMGKTPGETDLGIVPLATYHPESAGRYALRTPWRFDSESGSATMFGSLEKDAPVRVCTATREEILNAVEEAIRGPRGKAMVPAGALLVSCAGRKWLLEERCDEEVARVLAAVGKRIPLAGLPSFGEMGPFLKEDGSYTDTFFHNVTFVVCLFGE
ncbi:MAG: hypothetical protein QOE70_329 [Chthoniobacter sp.]|jgi:hypothetical protein|nr:hypothetical protein [Chthoniobacter sp.]